MSTFRETHKSQLNGSRSKQLYSFPKANRFTNSNYISPAPYYANKITAINPRATSFGYGSKCDFTKEYSFAHTVFPPARLPTRTTCPPSSPRLKN